MLQVRQAEKIIEGRSVLSIEQLDVAAGEVVAVVGPPSSGKTLLVRTVAGMLQPGGGKVMLDGVDIYQTPSARAHVGTLFAEDLLYKRLSVRENLEVYRRLYNEPKSKIDEVLKQVGLSDQAFWSIRKLSPAAQRRLAFARLLLHHASLYVLDQPILRTDADTQMLFARLIAQFAREGSAVLLTAEDLVWAGKCCTHVVELSAGRITNSYVAESKKTIAPERLTPYKVPARKEDRILLFDPVDVLYATSHEGKTILRTATEEAVTHLTLQELEGRLQGRGFFKAHRAYLVNLQHIKAVIQYTRNSYTLLLNDEKETMVPLSKQSEKELQTLLGY